MPPKSEVTYDMDSLMPLLFATIGNPSINYNKMAAMDTQGRTYSALEHKFRKWRQEGRNIAEQNPEHAGTFTAATPKKPRQTAAKKDSNGKASDNLDGEENCSNGLGDGQVKKEADTDADGENGVPSRMRDANGNPSKGSNKPKGTKKREASTEGDAEVEKDNSPTKKAKVIKKGMAIIIKKPSKKPHVSTETVTEDGSGSEEDEHARSPSKGKNAAKGRGPNKEGKKPVKNGKASVAGGENEDEDMDMEGKTEMEFVVEA